MDSRVRSDRSQPWYVIDEHRFIHDGLEIVMTNDFDSPVFDAYYGLQERCLPEHMQASRPSYQRLFALARGEGGDVLRERLGEFTEVVSIAREAGGEGAVVAAFAAAFFRWGDDPVRRSVATNYVMTDPGMRRRGYGTRIRDGVLQEMSRRIDGGAADARPFDIWIGDLADPFDPASGLPSSVPGGDIDHPVGRMFWSAASGARVLEFDYREPSGESESASGVPYLLMLFHSADGDRIGARLFRDHLERFLSISVLEGRDARRDPVASTLLEQLDDLARADGYVNSVSASDWLARRTRRAGA